MILPGHARPVPATPLLTAARRLLRPLVRLMMHSGVTYPVLADTLRRLFVEVAVSDILTDSKARTDSRISLLTGVHRKEIKRLREIPLDAAIVPGIVTLASEIVGRWLGRPEYLDAAGRPRPLPRETKIIANNNDKEISFDALVESVTSDIRPRAVLDDLLAHGAVYMDSEARIQLHDTAFIPRPGGEEQLFYFARNLHDHVAVAVANISASATPPYLDRTVHYDKLTQVQAATLMAFARAAAQRVLLEVNRRAIELTGSGPATPAASQWRVNFGVYVFDDADPPAPGPAP